MENNKQIVTVNSQNLPKLYQERQVKQILLEAARSLSPVEAQSALRIIEIEDNVKVNNTSNTEIVMLVGKIRMKIGSIKVEQPQLLMEANYIIENFSYITSQEVDEAFDLYIKGQLDIEIPDFVNFSCMFISKVMNAFLRRKARVKNNLEVKAREALHNLTQEPQSILRLRGTKECIETCFEHSHANPPFSERFFNQLVYDFLRKSKRLILTKEIVELSKDFAERKWNQDMVAISKEKKDNAARKQDPVHVGSVLKMEPARIYGKQSAIRQYAIDFCLKDFFDNNINNIGNILESITEEEFK